MKPLKCIKGLYRSVYKKNAFKKGATYHVVEEENGRVWVTDETGRPFSFTKVADGAMYALSEYFTEMP